MRIHAVGVPHTQLTGENPDCAFTQRLMRWSEMMVGRGHEVFLYGSEDSTAVCTEHIPCLTRDQYKRWFKSGAVHGTEPDQRGMPTYNRNLIREIGKRIEPGDFILITWGWPQVAVAQAFPNNTSIEGAIGYGSRVLDYAVYDSYMWMHYMYGKQSLAEGRFFDTAILGPFKPDEFLPAADHESYLLHIARLTPLKGVGIAQALAEIVDLPLVVCGGGDESLLTSDNVDYRGVVSHEDRAKLLQHATALVAPTRYIEPGGQVVVEAAMAGVPSITTDFGCFLETNQHGWRCHTMSEFAAASTMAMGWMLDERQALQEWARNEYGYDHVGQQWENYLIRLARLRSPDGVSAGPGFYG